AGASRARLYLSYPRVDMDQSRPRVPSFYGLEVMRAAEGALPGFDELARRAEEAAGARIGWPAPRDPIHAIHQAQYDPAPLPPIRAGARGHRALPALGQRAPGARAAIPRAALDGEEVDARRRPRRSGGPRPRRARSARARRPQLLAHRAPELRELPLQIPAP